MPKKTKRPRKLFTAAQRRHILAVAKKEGLTGKQVGKRFGINLFTFYRWRGPVRRSRATAKAVAAVDVAALRREVHAGIRKVLPRVIREEVSKALALLRRW